MPSGELIGAMIGAGVAAGCTAAAVVLLVSQRRQRSADLAARRVDLHARWLAARLALSRESASFVTAFRLLAVEPRKSAAFALRLEEAQRIRGRWHEAVASLDRAEAELVAWCDAAMTGEELRRIPRPGLSDLRRAVHGHETDTDELITRLAEQDRSAIAAVERRTRTLLSGSSRWKRSVSAAMWHLGDLFDPPGESR